MRKKKASAIMLTLLLTSMLALAFNIRRVTASGAVGVEAGCWIKCAYTISGWPSGTPYPEWLKVEFLGVEGTNATIRVTMHMSDGTEQNDTMTVDIAAGGGTFQGLSGFVIPANCTTGDSIYMTGYGNVTIGGETTGTYAGATRTVVFAGFSQYETQLTYHWDKLTGVMVEASVVSGGVTATAKATETNMWPDETTYIRTDGSVDPPDAPISTFDNVTYTLTGNITSDADGIVVEKDSIVMDGAGYMVQGTGNGTGITLSGRSNITIKNTEITTFHFGVVLDSSSNNSISGNNIRENDYAGLWLESSSNNTVSENNITNNDGGISLDSSSNNSLSGNNIAENNFAGLYFQSSSNNNSVSGNSITANNGHGMFFQSSSNNTISENNITANKGYGISLSESSNNVLDRNSITNNSQDGTLLCLESLNNTLVGNNITNNEYGISLSESSKNRIHGNDIIANNKYGIQLSVASENEIFHNDFINNTIQVYDWSWKYPSPPSINVWDDGYLSGGNYWSDYNGIDSNHDGIGDTPYVIDANNTDHYPLMVQYVIPEFPSFLILPLFFIATLLAVIIYKRKTKISDVM